MKQKFRRACLPSKASPLVGASGATKVKLHRPRARRLPRPRRGHALRLVIRLKAAVRAPRYARDPRLGRHQAGGRALGSRPNRRRQSHSARSCALVRRGQSLRRARELEGRSKPWSSMLFHANQLAAPCEGPRRALDGVAVMSPCERRRFITRARLDAAFGNCPRSVQSWASAVHWWLRFSKSVLGRDSPFPISAEDLQVASALFRFSGTFANYCGHWCTASELLSVSTAAFGERSVKRARQGIAKRCLAFPRIKRYVQHDLLVRVVGASLSGAMSASVRRDVAMLMCFGYAFLLRLPSEGLPAVFDGAVFNAQHRASVCLSAEALGLRLQRRKNSGLPVTIWRKCWCHTEGGTCTCPVHVLGAFFVSAGVGKQAFAAFSPADAVAAVRNAVRAVGAERPEEFDAKALRRGHALDLVERGAGLSEILRAGGWRSAAFIEYLPADSLERDAVLEARDNCSSDSDA